MLDFLDALWYCTDGVRRGGGLTDGKELAMTDLTKLAADRPPLRLGILGLGRAAFSRHLPQLRLMPQLFKVSAVCDLLKERRNLVEKEFPEARLYRQAADIIDDPEIEVLLIATPTADHESQARSALAHGKWTVLESPISTTSDGAALLKAASAKARGRLIPYIPGLFAPELALAKNALSDPRLGEVYEICVNRSDWVRRCDWQSVKRCGGGAAWYAAPDALHQALSLLDAPPSNMWSDLKRVTALGDAEDYIRIMLKTRTAVSASICINGGAVKPYPPSIEIKGSMGSFRIEEGAEAGVLRVVNPDKPLGRRRSSVRTPELGDIHEDVEFIEIPVAPGPDGDTAEAAFWIAAYSTVRSAQPFPVDIDDVVEAIRYLQLAKKSSPFAN